MTNSRRGNTGHNQIVKYSIIHSLIHLFIQSFVLHSRGYKSKRQNHNRNEKAYIYTREERKEGREEMFYLTMHSTHFIYGYILASVAY